MQRPDRIRFVGCVLLATTPILLGSIWSAPAVASSASRAPSDPDITGMWRLVTTDCDLSGCTETLRLHLVGT